MSPPDELQWETTSKCYCPVCTTGSNSQCRNYYSSNIRSSSSLRAPLFIDADNELSSRQISADDGPSDGPSQSLTGLLSTSPISFTTSPTLAHSDSGESGPQRQFDESPIRLGHTLPSCSGDLPRLSATSVSSNFGHLYLKSEDQVDIPGCAIVSSVDGSHQCDQDFVATCDPSSEITAQHSSEVVTSAVEVIRQWADSLISLCQKPMSMRGAQENAITAVNESVKLLVMLSTQEKRSTERIHPQLAMEGDRIPSGATYHLSPTDTSAITLASYPHPDEPSHSCVCQRCGFHTVLNPQRDALASSNESRSLGIRFTQKSSPFLYRQQPQSPDQASFSWSPTELSPPTTENSTEFPQITPPEPSMLSALPQLQQFESTCIRDKISPGSVSSSTETSVHSEARRHVCQSSGFKFPFSEVSDRAYPPYRKQRTLSETAVSTVSSVATTLHCTIGPSGMRSEVKKCRKVYGIEHRDQWCNQCRWKKACRRFPDAPSPNPISSKPIKSDAAAPSELARDEFELVSTDPLAQLSTSAGSIL